MSPAVKAHLAESVKKSTEMNAMFDAQCSVDRETDTFMASPDYTRAALLQMGGARSYGASQSYRLVFATAFADAWTERYTTLTGKTVTP